MAIEDGGPVYPTSAANYHADYSGTGISLRDHFAGLAMNALIVRGTTVGVELNRVELSWKYADAMLAARKGDGNG